MPFDLNRELKELQALAPDMVTGESRRVTTDLMIGGRLIEAGTPVTVMHPALQKDANGQEYLAVIVKYIEQLGTMQAIVYAAIPIDVARQLPVIGSNSR